MIPGHLYKHGCSQAAVRSEGFGSCFALIFQRPTDMPKYTSFWGIWGRSPTYQKTGKEGCFHYFRSNLRSYCRGHDSGRGTYSVTQSSSLQPWFKNWQELRKNKLTASTFGGAIGFWSGRRVQLWLEKIGAIQPFAGNAATSWSNIMEKDALARYMQFTGTSVLIPEFTVHGDKNSKKNWLGCSPDGMVDRNIYELPSRGVLEIKCPFFGSDKKIMYPWSRVPLYYIPQAQGLMEILDKDWMDFYCWTINGGSLFRLKRNQEYWELMETALSDFWWNHVIPGRELYRNSAIKNPCIEMGSLKPAPRHELYPIIVQRSKKLVDESELEFREIHGRIQLKPAWDFPQLKSDQLETEKYNLSKKVNREF